jgi:hypothetical protein
MTAFRSKASQVILAVSLVLAVVLLLELALTPTWPHISRTWLRDHPWLWSHSDDKTLLRLYIDSWFVALVLFVLAWLGAGSYKRRSLIVSGANIVGFPALFVALFSLTT